MIIVSDTNILGSLAAGNALTSLCQLYAKDRLVIPPAVRQELEEGWARGHQHLERVFLALQAKQIEIAALSAEEELHTFNYPSDLGDGEREAMALVQSRQGTLLSNDADAVLYCRRRGLPVLNLPDLLRLFWIENILSQDEVRSLIAEMARVESLSLKPKQLAEILLLCRQHLAL